jgi:2'-5' RNA ligase
MLSLDGETQRKKAIEVLDSLQPKIKEQLSGIDFNINIKGVDHFTMGRDGLTRVMFAKIQNDDSFKTLEKVADSVIQTFIDEKVVDPKDFDHTKYDSKNKM